GPSRALFCGDAKTGTDFWKRRLSALRLSSPLTDSVAPAITDGGMVFVYDEVPKWLGQKWTFSWGESGDPAWCASVRRAKWEWMFTALSTVEELYVNGGAPTRADALRRIPLGIRVAEKPDQTIEITGTWNGTKPRADGKNQGA